MKKNWSILLFACFVVIGFSSCKDEEAEWRDKNLAFIETIKNRDGIHEIGDAKNGYTGIYYEILEEGTGEKPLNGNTVSVTYSGWLYNDTITYTPKHLLMEDEAFDPSTNFEFLVGSTSIIDAWNLVIQRMPVGSKWRIYIPYNMGYGTTDQNSIPAYSTLIFDIRLRKITETN